MKCKISLYIYISILYTISIVFSIKFDNISNNNPQRKDNQIIMTSLKELTDNIIYTPSTLFEMPIDIENGLSYYAHYFYMAHLISFSYDIGTTKLESGCSSTNCKFVIHYHKINVSNVTLDSS